MCPLCLFCMKTLLQLLARYANTLLFLLLEIVAILLLVFNNGYQKSAALSSCNVVAAGMYQISDNITSYFALTTDNQRLAEENTALHNRITQLENQLTGLTDSLVQGSNYIAADKDLTYLSAKVINATTNRQHNYLTINRGSRDGVTTDMAVICDAGVVGVVCAVSEHFALVIPILHTDMSVSGKFARNDYVGTLHWDGRNVQYANLLDVARHVEVLEGETIVTSGLSTIFPANIPIGVVHETALTDHDAYYNIAIRLAVDFKRLNHVTIIQNHNQAEQVALEQTILAP